jgi:hypothetical protein
MASTTHKSIQAAIILTLLTLKKGEVARWGDWMSLRPPGRADVLNKVARKQAHTVQGTGRARQDQGHYVMLYSRTDTRSRPTSPLPHWLDLKAGTLRPSQP